MSFSSRRNNLFGAVAGMTNFSPEALLSTVEGMRAFLPFPVEDIEPRHTMERVIPLLVPGH